MPNRGSMLSRLDRSRNPGFRLKSTRRLAERRFSTRFFSEFSQVAARFSPHGDCQNCHRFERKCTFVNTAAVRNARRSGRSGSNGGGFRDRARFRDESRFCRPPQNFFVISCSARRSRPDTAESWPATGCPAAVRRGKLRLYGMTGVESLSWHGTFVRLDRPRTRGGLFLSRSESRSAVRRQASWPRGRRS